MVYGRAHPILAKVPDSEKCIPLLILMHRAAQLVIVPLSTEIIASSSNSSDKIVATNWGLISLSVPEPLLCPLTLGQPSVHKQKSLDRKPQGPPCPTKNASLFPVLRISAALSNKAWLDVMLEVPSDVRPGSLCMEYRFFSLRSSTLIGIIK
jgi:hypothetical protein